MEPTFYEKAKPLVALGLPVIPLVPGDKYPPSSMKGWQKERKFSTDLAVIEGWNQENPDYNVAMVAMAEEDGFCFLEFDAKPGLKTICAEFGRDYPDTRIHRSGKGGGHYIFKHTPATIALGNRQACLPDGREWFSFRADRKFLVGAGSLHPNGRHYEVVRDNPPLEMPDWLASWVAENSKSEHAPKKDETQPVADDFDFDHWCDHYSEIFTIQNAHEEGWMTTDVCPWSGHRHQQSFMTGFYYDGETLGFHCFAGGCEGYGQGIGATIKMMNDKVGPYPYLVWPETESSISVEDVACIESEPEEVTPEDIFGPGYQVITLQETRPEAMQASEPVVEPEALKELLYPELAFPRAEVLYPGSNLESLVSHACMAGDGKPYVLDPGLVTEGILTLASGLPYQDVMLDTRLSRYSVLLAVSRGGKGMAWRRASATLGLRDGEDYQRYSPSGHVQMIYQLGDKLEGKKPNVVRIPGPKKITWITEELSGCLKMAASDGSKVMQQLLEFYDNSVFSHTDTKTGRQCKMDCRLSWGTCLAIGFGKIEERKFSDTFQDVSNDGLIGRMFFGFSEQHVDSRDLEGWQPPAIEMTSTEVEGIGVVESHAENMSSRISRHVVRGYDPGVFKAYREYEMSSDLEFPGWQHALKKTMVHIALVNLHENISMPDFLAARAYVRWQAALRKVFRPSQADDQPQARFQEMVKRALRKADTAMAKTGKPAESRTIYVPRVAQRHEWSDRGKSIGLDKTIIELANMGVLTLNTTTDNHGKETRDWKRVRVTHPRGGCWCGNPHPKTDNEDQQS